MEEKAMGIPDKSITEYRLRYPGLFPQAEDRAAIEAGVQGAQVGKKGVDINIIYPLNLSHMCTVSWTIWIYILNSAPQPSAFFLFEGGG